MYYLILVMLYLLLLLILLILFSINWGTITNISSSIIFECGFISSLVNYIKYKYNYWLIVFHFILFEQEILLLLFLLFSYIISSLLFINYILLVYLLIDILFIFN